MSMITTHDGQAGDGHDDVNRSESGRAAFEVLTASGGLDEVLAKIDAGEVQLTGEGGYLREMVTAVLERGPETEDTSHLGSGFGRDHKVHVAGDDGDTPIEIGAPRMRGRRKAFGEFGARVPSGAPQLDEGDLPPGRPSPGIDAARPSCGISEVSAPQAFSPSGSQIRAFRRAFD